MPISKAMNLRLDDSYSKVLRLFIDTDGKPTKRAVVPLINTYGKILSGGIVPNAQQYRELYKIFADRFEEVKHENDHNLFTSGIPIHRQQELTAMPLPEEIDLSFLKPEAPKAPPITDDATKKAQEDAAKKAQEDAAKKAAEDAAKKAQEDATKKAQEDAAKKAQEDAAKKAADEAAKKAQEDAKKAAEESAKKAKEDTDDLNKASQQSSFPVLSYYSPQQLKDIRNYMDMINKGRGDLNTFGNFIKALYGHDLNQREKDEWKRQYDLYRSQTQTDRSLSEARLAKQTFEALYGKFPDMESLKTPLMKEEDAIRERNKNLAVQNQAQNDLNQLKVIYDAKLERNKQVVLNSLQKIVNRMSQEHCNIPAVPFRKRTFKTLAQLPSKKQKLLCDDLNKEYLRLKDALQKLNGAQPFETFIRNPKLRTQLNIKETAIDALMDTLEPRINLPVGSPGQLNPLTGQQYTPGEISSAATRLIGALRNYINKIPEFQDIEMQEIVTTGTSTLLATTLTALGMLFVP